MVRLWKEKKGGNINLFQQNALNIHVKFSKKQKRMKFAAKWIEKNKISY